MGAICGALEQSVSFSFLVHVASFESDPTDELALSFRNSELESDTRTSKDLTSTGLRSDSSTSASRPTSELPTLESSTTRCPEGELSLLFFDRSLATRAYQFLLFLFRRQYTNLQFQASQLGLGTQWTEIKKKYIEANQLVSFFPSFSLPSPLKQQLIFFPSSFRPSLHSVEISSRSLPRRRL